MAWSAEGVYLSVKDSPESVSRRLGFAIDRTGMKPLEPASNGAHRFEYVHIRYDDRSFWQKLAFWSDGSAPDHSGIYRTRLVPDGENTRVYLELDSGAPATTSAEQRSSADPVFAVWAERR